MPRSDDLLRVAMIGLAVWFVSLNGVGDTATAGEEAAAGEAENAGTPDRSQSVPAAEIKQLRRQVEAMRQELGEVQAALERIEGALDRQQGPSEFSPVTIRVQSEDGRPLAGFLVEMESAPKEGRRVFASSRSDRTGVALSRELPYGDYRLKIKEKSGWSTSFRTVTVEIGATFDKVIVAPDPQQRATLRLDAAIDPQRVEGLRFGERRIGPPISGFAVPNSPEPGEKAGRFASFPTLDDGISEVAVEVRLEVVREIIQPDDKLQKWNWAPRNESLPRILVSQNGLVTSSVPWILATKNGVITLGNLDEKTARPRGSAQYFAPGKEISSEAFTVAFLKLDIERTVEQEAALEIASGEVTLLLTRVVGKAEPAVLPSLGVEGDAEIWLAANLKGKSAWIPRLLDLKGWDREDGSSYFAKKTETVGPGETMRASVKSP